MANPDKYLLTGQQLKTESSQETKDNIEITFDNSSEAVIWQRFKRGNDKAFLFIYRKYVKSLFNYGCQFTADRELVKDCIHDLFVSLKRKHRILADIKFIKPYLFKSLRNDIIRTVNKKQKYLSYDEQVAQEFKITIAHESKLIDEELFLESREALNRAFKDLPPRQREAVLLYYYEGLSYKEIAQILDIKMVKSARKLIYRAINNMRKGINFILSVVIFISIDF